MPRPTRHLDWFLAACLACAATAHGAPAAYDVVIRHGVLYDGTGGAPLPGEVAIKDDRIAYVGARAPGHGRTEIDAHGHAVAPGFINMLAHPEESLFADGRALSDLVQGVTLEVLGEDSMGPLNARMKELGAQRQSDIKYPISWTTLGEYLDTVARRGIAPNIASTVGGATVRTYVLGEGDVQPTPEQLAQMRHLVRQAMEEGALGLSTALIYSPGSYAKTPEIAALATESGACGGMYLSHMRSEGDRLLEGVDELIDIARTSGAPAEIYHLKASGKPNWDKLDAVIARVEKARADGTRITADMYTYTAGATGLDAAMPPWVQDGGLEAWIEHLKDPATRAKVIAAMRDPAPNWENLALRAGPDGTLLLAFKNPALKPLTGRTLASVAAERHASPEDTAIDLVIEDGTRVGVAYFLMSEENVRRETSLPWVSFGSDEEGAAPEGVFLASNNHPRAYGNFARLLGKYVRDEHALSLAAAVHKLSGLPASNLSLADRGLLKVGYVADIVVFDPTTVADHATYDHPHQLATGVSEVLVNGRLAVSSGTATGAATGRVVRGRAWTGRPGGGCRAASRDWTWNR
jgi:N-acyl-D-amino-acid deacylase